MWMIKEKLINVDTRTKILIKSHIRYSDAIIIVLIKFKMKFN